LQYSVQTTNPPSPENVLWRVATFKTLLNASKVLNVATRHKKVPQVTKCRTAILCRSLFVASLFG